MELVIFKVIHVLAAVVAVGANVTYAVWLQGAGRDRNHLAFAIAGIRRLDRYLANPAYILLAITGVLMVVRGGYSFTMPWIAASTVLYVATALIGIVLFVPAIARQGAEAERDPDSPAYAAAARRVNIVGGTATLIAVVIVILMVAKPA